MSADEVFALFLGGIAAAWSWYRWYLTAASVERLGAPAPGRVVVWWWPLVCAMALFAVLKTASSFDVRNDLVYITLYMILGAGWVGVTMQLFALTGISPREDILERGNPAAVPAVAGALLGITLCFAGGNVGDGPGWWVVVYSAGLATVTLGILLLLFDQFTGIADAVSVERDRAAGVRLGGLLVAAGLILGRGVAGDWVSSAATLRDFIMTAWPILPLFAIAGVLEAGARPTPERLIRSVTLLGVPPAVLYVLAAAAYVIALGAT